MSNRNKNIRVGLAWQTLTSTNLGVGALAESQIGIVQAAAKRAGLTTELVQFCNSETSIDRVLARGIELGPSMSIKQMLLGRSNFLPAILACDVVLDIGEGDSFSDIYGFKRFTWLSLLKLYVIWAARPLVISPQTIGPFNSLVARIISTWLMRRAHRVFARDGLSGDYLRAAGITANTDEAIDVAFRLPFTRQDQPESGVVHVGVNISGLLYNGGYTRDNQFGLTVDYKLLVHQLLQTLSSRSDIRVHLVSHVIADDFEVEDDYRVCQELQHKFSSAILAPKFDSPSEAKSYIAGLNFFTGARMHACIGAFSSGVPVVPMAYSRKFNGLFNSLGYTAIVDLKVLDTAAAHSAILAGLDEKDALKSLVAKGNQIANTKLQRYEDYLTELFRSTYARKVA